MNVFSPIVDVAWLRTRLGQPGIVVVDTRPYPEFRAGHIPGALHSDQNAIRMLNSSPAAIERFVQAAAAEAGRLGIERGNRVIFYETISGCYAARGAWMLDFIGVPGAAILDGGIAAWVASGGAIDRTILQATPTILVAEPDRTTLATAEQLVESLTDNAHAISVIDTRSDQEYWSGTVPGSVHLEWTQTLDESGKFLAPDQLRSLYASAGLNVDDATQVATFCGAGYRAAHTYLALKSLGIEHVVNYAPSWNEWGSRRDLPVEQPER
jgi:thiosulfate/3-mercaptopyruvate sulfurtransferase